MESPILTHLIRLLRDLYGETQGFLDRQEDVQLWYNRGYANGMVLAMRALGRRGALPADLALDPDSETWEQIAKQALMPWGRAHAHGLEMGRKETFAVLGGGTDLRGTELLTLCSFNINGIRARPHQLEALKSSLDPDILGIQECKVADAEFPLDSVEGLGYRAHFHGQKGHYGVALLSKGQPLEVRKGLPDDDEDSQRRLITGRFGLPGGVGLTVINGYFPQGESRDHPIKFPGKARFYADLTRYVQGHFSPDQNLVLMGDMNVAPLDQDIGIGPDNAKRWLREGKCSFLPEEREWLKVLTDWGLFDAYRVVHPAVDDRFSWFDYRSKGFEREPRRGLRIDLLLVSAPLRERLVDAGIDYDIRAMERPSDHCPVWARFDV